MTEGYYNRNNQWIPAEDVLDAIEHLMATCVERRMRGDETFVKCRMCDGWEGHEGGCPIARLQAWQEEA